ncbi:FAD:protein FMN transferase [Elizabethkingia anophelis]|uniref:FAD:protein FMN transferase n=1 Tax=Elizabethkingia anophelis TaxID=1117645 RepID=UPI0020B3E450|nr:FAD:protein FMN transferase [Elizabethkingia anophelis]UTF94454.1 FAD:protein FMN transferase [Elizabethkingia anophelis]
MNKTDLFIRITLLLCTISISAQVQRSRLITLMGSRFQITLVDKDSISAERNIDKAVAEITRIENLISEWRPETQISQVNQNAGIKPIKVDREVFDLTKKGLYFSKLTDGAFDISIVAMDKIWKFDDSMDELPSEQAIKESVRNVDYRNIILDSTNSTIFLRNPGMKIGFGSIGKGYAADKTRDLMKSMGVKAGIIDASGDISTWGTQPDGKPWAIGINNPFNDHKMAAILYFKENSVTTSGSYEKYAEINRKRYSHIMNPKTGYPSTGLTSVTITGPNATMANGFSTSVMVLGEKEGLKLLKQFPEYHYLLITDKGKIVKNIK